MEYARSYQGNSVLIETYWNVKTEVKQEDGSTILY